MFCNLYFEICAICVNGHAFIYKNFPLCTLRTQCPVIKLCHRKIRCLIGARQPIGRGQPISGCNARCTQCPYRSTTETTPHTDLIFDRCVTAGWALSIQSRGTLFNRTTDPNRIQQSRYNIWSVHHNWLSQFFYRWSISINAAFQTAGRPRLDANCKFWRCTSGIECLMVFTVYWFCIWFDYSVYFQVKPRFIPDGDHTQSAASLRGSVPKPCFDLDRLSFSINISDIDLRC